jgi:hypothetical protein
MNLRGTSLALALSCLSCFAGCASKKMPPVPRDRMGCLPFPGTFTLHTTADPSQLGQHRYGRIPRLFEDDEKERGIIYTTRAGFLDLAHLRESIDWTRYETVRMRKAIAAGKKRVDLAGKDNALFRVTLNYPKDWKRIPKAEREMLIDELALRCGERLAFLSMTWHEIITWFGHSLTSLIDERPSSFTWDDTTSHMVGIRVGARALRDRTPGSFDTAVTRALSAELKRLGAVTPEKTNVAELMVEGVWWTGSSPLKRQFPLGWADPVVYPWTVSDFPTAKKTTPVKLSLLGFDDVRGREFSDFMSVQVSPRIFEGPRICACLPGKPKKLSADDDLLRLVGIVREQMQEQFGMSVCDPSAPASNSAVASQDDDTDTAGGS